MAGLCATDHANDTFATNDFAIAANFLYRCPNFHDDTPNKLLRRLTGAATVIFKVCFFHHRIVLVRHHVRLHLSHEIHNHDHNNQQ